MNAKEAADLSNTAKTVKLDSNLDIVFKAIKIAALHSKRKTLLPIGKLYDMSEEALEDLRVYLITHGYSVHLEYSYIYISW
jgi:hypothetical protein